jgi:hypothetical protein
MTVLPRQAWDKDTCRGNSKKEDFFLQGWAPDDRKGPWRTGTVRKNAFYTANCTTIDHCSAFESELVALFLTLPLKHGWVRAKTARNLNLGVSRNCFCDFLADPDSRSFSRFGAIIMQFAVTPFPFAI